MSQTIDEEMRKELDDPTVSNGFNEFYGKVLVDTFWCVLVKGAGKIPFDPGQHQVDQRKLAVKIEIIPLAEHNYQWQLLRDTMTFSRDYTSVILPSLKTLGESVYSINGKWARVMLKDTGETYTSKKDGAVHSKTSFEFLAIYPDEAACRAAFQKAQGGASAQTPSQAPTNGANKEQETALKFLRVIVSNSVMGQSDLGVITNTVAANIANMPMVAKYFTAQSPETMQMIAEVMAK